MNGEETKQDAAGQSLFSGASMVVGLP